MAVEPRDVAEGVWIWRLGHPAWAPHVGWPPRVTSTCVVSHGEPVHDRAAYERALALPPWSDG